MRVKIDAEPEFTPVAYEPEMAVHPSAQELPLMSAEAWAEFKASILSSGGNREPVVFYGQQLLDGRNRVRAIQQLRAEGHSVELRTMEWNDTGDETITEFILRVNLLRRHLTDDQRAAIALKLVPQIQAEAAQRKADARIQPGEHRNPYGRRGKPKLAEADSPPQSAEERRERNRRKEAKSAAGQLANQAGVTTHKAKRVMKAVKIAGPQAIDQLVAGTATARQLIGKPSKQKEAPDPHLQMEFRKFVKSEYRRLLEKHLVANRKAVRAYLIKLIRGEQTKYGEVKKARSFVHDCGKGSAVGVAS